MNDTREFIAILRYDETDSPKETAPGEFLEREFGWLEQSGISLESWALVDDDVRWECFLRYLVQWAIDHNSDEYSGMSPASYDEWKSCEGRA